jgi:hypothetical protein
MGGGRAGHARPLRARRCRRKHKEPAPKKGAGRDASSKKNGGGKYSLRPLSLGYSSLYCNTVIGVTMVPP